MARPKKDSSEKRDKRLTLYLTGAELDLLNTVASGLDTDKTKVVTKSLNRYIKSLEDPPPTLRQASYEQIMQQDKEQLNGYICAKGHAFWLQWEWPSPPICCPCCGEKEIKHGWAGIVKKGF